MGDDSAPAPAPATQLDYYYALQLLHYSLTQIVQKQREVAENDIGSQRLIAQQYIAQFEAVQPALDTISPVLAQLSLERLKKQAPTLFDLVEPVGIQPSLSATERKYSILNEMRVIRAAVGAAAQEMQASHERMNDTPHSSAMFDAVFAQVRKLHTRDVTEAHRDTFTSKGLVG